MKEGITKKIRGVDFPLETYDKNIVCTEIAKTFMFFDTEISPEGRNLLFNEVQQRFKNLRQKEFIKVLNNGIEGEYLDRHKHPFKLRMIDVFTWCSLYQQDNPKARVNRKLYK